MKRPTSTYRLQFRNGMTFDDAIDLVPHLVSLGISHLYASPIFTAVGGSTHGYDVTDANEIDPAIGGQAGFERLAEALREANLGLILDIVPNHMAASVENGWWRDVLENGRQSAFSSYFDIDWREKLTLPLLGKPLPEVLADNELVLVTDGNDGLELAYYETRLPLDRKTVRRVLSETAGGNLSCFSGDKQKMQALLAEQHWQLTHWKDAAKHLSYRRFFEVTGLVGIRIEDDAVFEHTHRLILRLVRTGRVQGLRVDHVDGLAAPQSYLDRLRHAIGPDIYLIVEKILGPGEQLRPSWPVEGTTGYEFNTALATLYIDQDGLDHLEAGYGKLAPPDSMLATGLRDAKRLIAGRNFAGEGARLAALVKTAHPHLQEADILSALQELLVAFPVYRTYGDEGRLDAEDETVLAGVLAEAEAEAMLPSRTALDAIAGLLRNPDEEHLEFRRRFQQLTGPVMAKAVEDTFFYRYNRLLALNEVGGEIIRPETGVAAFHRLMADRARHQPHGLSATSTHDTKRGEDARARLYTLCEGSEVWNEAVERWRGMNMRHLASVSGRNVPEAAVEWMLYQALAGAWSDDTTQENLASRFLAYTEKASREAKLGTDWAAPDEDYEKAVLSYAEALVSPQNADFTEDFQLTMQPFLEAGYSNSLSQTLIKLTAPGIPDVYQGTEGLDLSMVDPDNRRPVDYARFSSNARGSKTLSGAAANMKQAVLTAILQYRKDHPALFNEGDYQPLDVTGPCKDHLVAFARRKGEEYLVAIAPRLMFGKLQAHALVAVPGFWSDTTVKLPADAGRPLRDLLGGSEIAGTQITVETLLTERPVACLVMADS
ncbi:malto-oligosyltrehalose synthase [Pararhizobium gei]|uniref:malto-oligosyltrehalose synthase n=1 Tax=Pararhizobium gei TaxID=1395951 RepID=UPI0023DBDEAD|nr:malto-oligosyltrehalose synthase [Rhizobium gei]